MKAAIRRNYGPPETIKIEEVDIPVPKDNEVLIQILASTVNRTDCANLTAKPFIMRFGLGLLKPKQITLGTDFAGKVISVGEKVNSFKVDDHVFGLDDGGLESQAQYACIGEENVMAMPDNINFKQAAASLEGAYYAHAFVHRVSIQPGQKVFINGATGAIGSALLQFVNQFDVEISASCNTENMERIRSLGAQKVYDYTKEDFTNLDEEFDFVFDSVGKSTFGACKSILKKDGIYISSELGPYIQNVFFALFTPLRAGKKVIFPMPYPRPIALPYVLDMIKNNHFTPVIDREYSLENIAEAYRYVMSGKKIGNVVLRMD